MSTTPDQLEALLEVYQPELDTQNIQVPTQGTVGISPVTGTAIAVAFTQ